MATSVGDLEREIRKPGKVKMPVLMCGDVLHLTIEKAALLDLLKGYKLDDPAPWSVILREDGCITLDVDHT